MVVVFNATFSTFVAVSCVDGGNRSKVCYLCLLHTIFWIFSMFFFSCELSFLQEGIFDFQYFRYIHVYTFYVDTSAEELLITYGIIRPVVSVRHRRGLLDLFLIYSS